MAGGTSGPVPAVQHDVFASPPDVSLWFAANDDDDVPPTPPPKTPRSMGFAAKQQQIPLQPNRRPAVTTTAYSDEHGALYVVHHDPSQRPAHAASPVPSSSSSSTSASRPTLSAPTIAVSSPGPLRKQKSSPFNILKKLSQRPLSAKRSSADADPSSSQSALATVTATANGGGGGEGSGSSRQGSSFLPSMRSRKDKDRDRDRGNGWGDHKGSAGSVSDDYGNGASASLYDIDLDLRDLTGIIDPSRLSASTGVNGSGGSGTRGAGGYNDTDDVDDDVDVALSISMLPPAPLSTSVSPPTFSNPFGSTTALELVDSSAHAPVPSSSRHHGHHHGHKLTKQPTSRAAAAAAADALLAPSARVEPAVVPEQLRIQEGDWKPPQSWGIPDPSDPEFGRPAPATAPSSTAPGAGDALNSGGGSGESGEWRARNSHDGDGSRGGAGGAGGEGSVRSRRSRGSGRGGESKTNGVNGYGYGHNGDVETRPPPPRFSFRVHISESSFRVMRLPLDTQVSSVMRFLNKELRQPSDPETYRLYLKERGRERILANTERPADIVRRRLEQAGYTDKDGLEDLGSQSLSFLLKFVYKSTAFGLEEEELHFRSYRHVDLTNKGLRTIPIMLYRHAEDISSLDLSRNPMIEIPDDFVLSCTSLRELRLSNMAIKKVPNSVRDCVTLYKLDLSCNRIPNLDDAALDRIPELTALLVQNNRMETLSWYFPRLRALRTLNISNNKFQEFPQVVCQLPTLTELDISFNMISVLPDDIGRLAHLEKFILVGNRVRALPEACLRLRQLRVLDCRRNAIADVPQYVSCLPALEEFYADHNALHALDLSAGPLLTTLDVAYNDITSIGISLGPLGQSPVSLTSLNISHAKLSSLDDFDLAQLSALQTLILDDNTFRRIPDSLGELKNLVSFSCADNTLEALPATIGNLTRLERLDVHNNNIAEVPAGIWACRNLKRINMTSNVISLWHPPDADILAASASISSSALVPSSSSSSMATVTAAVAGHLASGATAVAERKVSTASSVLARAVPPPLVNALEGLYLGENNLGDEALGVLATLRELRVLNLSFNAIQELPRAFFRDMVHLQELYVSGNKLASLPTEDLHRLQSLRTLFLNGNRLRTLPQELGKVTGLMMLDVGSNQLKYNITNWEFDWNWNFNKNLRYLNLSGNKRLEIKPARKPPATAITGSMNGKDKDRERERERDDAPLDTLAGFTGLTQLRVLGLMDVTTTFLTQATAIPDDTEDRRVRTSLSEVNDMQYGIADNLGPGGDYVAMFDLVTPNFRGRTNEALFAMFGRAQAPAANSPVAHYLRDNFARTFEFVLSKLNFARKETAVDALRRTFLTLNWLAHDFVFSQQQQQQQGRKNSSASGSTFYAPPQPMSSFCPVPSGSASTPAPSLLSAPAVADPSAIGASGIVAYVAGRKLFVANAGNALAVVSRRGHAEPVARKHDPFDRYEIERIRAAEGWVSPKGLVNDEVVVSRSFGYYHLVPVVNAKPDVHEYELTEGDEFIIIANSGLWDYVSYQTAVDIARTEKDDPMIAAQKLRDFAISYGAEGTTMIMVISTPAAVLARNENGADDVAFLRSNKFKARKLEIARMLQRLPEEPPPPVGYVALVFTDIRNSTMLWDTNSGMATAIKLHHELLRRELRVLAGYEVKTEGDAFMVAFENVAAALLWCVTVQTRLLEEAWPQEILECAEGRERRDANGTVVARGLSVRMGIHCGTPVCETDVTTKRMDYYGPMVNRAARVMGSAAGGQIMVTADVAAEIRAWGILADEPSAGGEHPSSLASDLRAFKLSLVRVGEVKLKGLEMPETLTLVYPERLLGRQDLDADASDDSDGDSQQNQDKSQLAVDTICTVDQVRELARLTVRIQALAAGRVFYPTPARRGSAPSGDERLPPLPAPTVLPTRLRPSASTSLTQRPVPPETYLCIDPAMLLPTVPDRASESEVLSVLEYVLLVLEAAVDALVRRYKFPELDELLRLVHTHEKVIDRAQVAAIISAMRLS